MGATRNLLAFAAQRVAGYLITLNYSVKTYQRGGTYALNPSPVNEWAYVVDLSEDQINRLQEGGITVNDGISVTIPKELASIPDTITYGADVYTQDIYTIIRDVISEGVTILTCSRKPYGSANVEAGA